MTELHLAIPDWVFTALTILGGVMAYSFIGAVFAGIFNRLGWDGSGNAPPAEAAGLFWPITLAILLIVLALHIMWWTVFLPARGAFFLIAKSEKK